VSTHRLAIDIRRFPWSRRLAADYAFDFSRVAPFFAGDPAAHDHWTATIARTQAHARRRDELTAVLTAQQQRRQAPAAARARTAQLADPGTVAIVTGQQAGLFGGPLYTLLKAMTAIRLAGKISREHQVAAVPVFWVEAEDHDWDEVRSCTVFDDQLETRAVSLPPRVSADPTPVSRIVIDPSVASLIDELASVLPSTEFTPPLIDDLRRAYAPGVGMADAFARWLEQVLGPRGLIVYDASDVATKPLVAPVFARELATAGQTSRLAAASGAELVARGYHAQVHAPDHAPDDSPALFRLDPTLSASMRRAIKHHDGHLVVGDTSYSTDALQQDALSHPAAFSPGVLLRPIVQDTLFPTVCYVAGPSELAYLGQLRGVYQHFGVPMPLFYPRASATILDSASLRFLTKYDLPLEALQPQDEAALNGLLETQIPPAVEQSFTAARQAVDTHLAALGEGLRAIDPTLEGAARSTLTRLQHDLETLHGKMIQAAKRRHDTLRRQFAHARARAFPGGQPQERTIAFLWFLNQYGPALLDRLDDDLPLDLGHHWIVAL
jgi:bacillithiol biosynthesis cysteine-adding enzyme BshC